MIQTPVQQPIQPPIQPMQLAQPGEETIIRFSQAWFGYNFLRLGALRTLVNTIEDALAITGRLLLLIFLLYSGTKAGAWLIDPHFAFPIALEMSMFILQLAGLEGAIPGLARQAEALRQKGDKVAAKKLDYVMTSARVMTILSISEGALHALSIPPGALQDISAILLVVRGAVITEFLVELAKKENKAPRILSKMAHEEEKAHAALQDGQTRTIAELRAHVQQQQQQHETDALAVRQAQADLEAQQKVIQETYEATQRKNEEHLQQELAHQAALSHEQIQQAKREAEYLQQELTRQATISQEQIQQAKREAEHLLAEMKKRLEESTQQQPVPVPVPIKEKVQVLRAIPPQKQKQREERKEETESMAPITATIVEDLYTHGTFLYHDPLADGNNYLTVGKAAQDWGTTDKRLKGFLAKNPTYHIISKDKNGTVQANLINACVQQLLEEQQQAS